MVVLLFNRGSDTGPFGVISVHLHAKPMRLIIVHNNTYTLVVNQYIGRIEDDFLLCLDHHKALPLAYAEQ